jgi:hypothetical protein
MRLCPSLSLHSARLSARHVSDGGSARASLRSLPASGNAGSPRSNAARPTLPLTRSAGFSKRRATTRRRRASLLAPNNWKPRLEMAAHPCGCPAAGPITTFLSCSESPAGTVTFDRDNLTRRTRRAQRRRAMDHKAAARRAPARHATLDRAATARRPSASTNGRPRAVSHFGGRGVASQALPAGQL